MTPIRQETSKALQAVIVLAALAVFAGDCLLPLGLAVWVLYFVPVALSKFAWRPSLPLIVAGVCSAFVVAGYYVKLEGAEARDAYYSPFNRTFGVVTLAIAAFIGQRFIRSRLTLRQKDWFTAGQAGLGKCTEGEQSHVRLGENVLAFCADYVDAQVGALYLVEADGSCRRVATHAVDPAFAGPEAIRPGEGIVGQVARDRRIVQLSEVPEKYLDVRSGLGGHPPRQVVVAPASVDGKVHAVLELGFLNPVHPIVIELLTQLSSSIASAVRSASYRARQQELLAETQRQAEELQAQQEELRVQNEELEQQSRTLQESQARLESQQAELEQINTQLEEQTQALARQRDDLKRAHLELSRANTYKSEFLANMSHELRTPLNSTLILAKLLADNREGNLSAEQIRFAETIYSAGNDLLTLINDILDLSKIEAGKLDVRPDVVPLPRLVDELKATFEPVANEKRLSLTASIDEGLPASLQTDPTRLLQILKNLLSNALKFTERGGVSLRIRRAAPGALAFDVRDTGIGIPPEQHEVIFEAFRQADGTTNRKYGGTGLGLSISRDLARLLGGELELDSAVGRGSTFRLVLPEVFAPPAGDSPPASAGGYTAPAGAAAYTAPQAAVEPLPVTRHAAPVEPAPTRAAPSTSTPALADDRERVEPHSRAILIIEDDPAFAAILRDLAHELDFRVLLASTGDDGLAMAERYLPSAILLDVKLPDRSGLSVLDALKHSPKTRHIPVHMASVSDYTQAALEMGAIGFAMKPAGREELVLALRRLEAKFTQRVRRILVVEDDEVHRDSTRRLLEGDDVQISAVGSAAQALEQLRASTFDAMVLDLSLPDRTGFELLRDMAQQDQYSFPPVIVYTGRSLSRAEEQELRRFSRSIIIKGARSPERLLDEVTLFLHQVEEELPPERQRMLREARHREAVFEGRRVLVVEDDVRNIFALSSVLEPRGAKVEIARNGREALEHLEQDPGVDLVLMDIMMPEMDGLSAMREIRKRERFAKLPIIALTAKAMVDDRESCLAAGANDYIAKPLDVDKLLSLARVWMPK